MSAGTGVGGGIGISVGGQNGAQVAFLLDGQDNNNQQIAVRDQKEVIKPSIDAIQEFKVVTNSYSAEYGRSSAGVVSVALKSGTNSVNGAVYEFFRDAKFDAKDYFAAEKQPFRRDQFGGALGGPIVRNKTFVFGDVEAGTHPPDQPGDLDAAVRRTAARTVHQRDSRPTDGPAVSRTTRFPRRASTRSPPRRSGYLPAAADVGGRPTTTCSTAPRDQDAKKGDVRVDQIISGNQNAYFRYSYQDFKDSASAPLPPDANGNVYSGGGADTSISHSWVGVHNKVWTPKVLSSFRVGANSIAWSSEIPDQALKASAFPASRSPSRGSRSWRSPGIRAGA